MSDRGPFHSSNTPDGAQRVDLIINVSMKMECGYLCGWIKKRSHAQKSHPKWLTQEIQLGVQEKKKIMNVPYKLILAVCDTRLWETVVVVVVVRCCCCCCSSSSSSSFSSSSSSFSSSSSSKFAAMSLGFIIFGEMFVYVAVF